MSTHPITPAQQRVLDVIDKHGASMLGMWTNPKLNIVHNGAARALVAAGILRTERAADGIFAERPTPEGAPPTPTLHLSLEAALAGYEDRLVGLRERQRQLAGVLAGRCRPMPAEYHRPRDVVEDYGYVRGQAEALARVIRELRAPRPCRSPR